MVLVRMCVCGVCHACMCVWTLSVCLAVGHVCNHTASKGVCCVCVCMLVHMLIRDYKRILCVLVGGRRGRGDEHVCVPAYMHVLSMNVYCRCY